MKVKSVTTGLIFDWPTETCEALILNGSVEPVEDESPTPRKKTTARKPSAE